MKYFYFTFKIGNEEESYKMKKKKHIYLFLVILLCILFFHLCQSVLHKNDELKNVFVKNDYVHLSDNFLDLNLYLNDDQFFAKLCTINERIKAEDGFIFSECYIGDVYLSADYILPDYIPKARNGKYRIPTVKVGENINAFFDLECLNNSSFQSTDFLYRDNVIPVIIGNDYKKYFSVDDTLDCVVNGKNYTLLVKDILTENESIIYYNQEIMLDSYWIIPFENFNSNSAKKPNSRYAFSTLLEKNSGIIKVNENYTVKNAMSDVKAICESLDLPTYSRSISYKELFFEMVMVFFLSMILLSLILFLLYILFKHRIKNDQ